MDRRKIEFDWMNRDEVCGHVVLQSNPFEVTYDIFTNEVHKMFAVPGKTINPEQLNTLLENRCFSRNREDCDELLSMLGLINYNPMDIIRKTHGAMSHDNMWVRFSDEPDLRFMDVHFRGRR